jgi:hypothetical protein
MIIGIVGFAGSGKGTVGDILIRDYDFHRLSFADGVKDAVAVIFGWPRHLLEGDTSESRDFRETKDEWWSEKFGYEVTPRFMMQKMGTEAGREVFHDQLWVHALARKAEQYKNVVIPDVRFPNEIEYIRNSGGFVIRVSRGKDPKWFETARTANKTKDHSEMIKNNIHYSEWAWIGSTFDYQLPNNGSLIMLESDVKHMLKVFTGSDIMNEVA